MVMLVMMVMMVMMVMICYDYDVDDVDACDVCDARAACDQTVHEGFGDRTSCICGLGNPLH